MTWTLEDEFLAAFDLWDRAAARIGKAAQAALDAGKRPRRPSGDALEREAARLTRAQAALGLPLGWCTRLGAMRWSADGRELMDAASAAQAVLHEHQAGTLTEHLRVG